MSTKRKLPTKLGVPLVKPSAKEIQQPNVDESKAVVSQGGNAVKPTRFKPGEVVDISSESSSEEEDDSEDEFEHKSTQQSDAEEDVTMQDADVGAKEDQDANAAPEQDNEESAEPSFGDLQAQATETVDVAAAFEQYPQRTTPQTKQLQVPTGASLGTVLSQALRTNDVSLFESCLQVRDVGTIRATIQRLDSPLAGTLLQRLAERLHRRPGRAGSLLIWVQWTLVTHGGYLATQRDLIKKLEELNRVISDRAKSLQSLLSLKGKLDMLEAQIELRRHMQTQHRRGEEEDDEEGVIYVEGEESEEDVAVNGKPGKDVRMSGVQGGPDAESEESEDMPNGIIQDSEDEEDESSDDDLIDEEAEETDADGGDEDEVNHDDADSLGEEDDSDDGLRASGPPSKIQRTSGQSMKKRS